MEVRIQIGKNHFRLLGFEYKGTFVILTNGFKKKIKRFQSLKSSLPNNEERSILKMSDLKKYIHQRKQRDQKFADGYDSGYQDFKIGEILKQARLEARLTQEEMAEKLHTQKSAISRIENHAQDIRLSTLQNFAHMMGRELKIQLV